MKKPLLLLIMLIAVAFTQAQGIQMVKENKYVLYTEKPGSVVVHVGNQMFNRMNSTSMPLSVAAEVTVLPNLTAGPMFTYFRFVSWEKVAKSMTEYENVDVKYNQYFLGLRANYHLTPFIEGLINKKLGREYFDLYVGGWVGYSLSNSNHRLANPEVINATQKMRAGVLAGVRSMIVPRFGLFMELGYSSYGLGAFGCTVKLR
jgi:hypothetical protein